MYDALRLESWRDSVDKFNSWRKKQSGKIVSQRIFPFRNRPDSLEIV